MFSAFLIHSLLCGCITLVYFILRKLTKVSPTVRYICDCIMFLYYAFPTMLLPVNKVTGIGVQILEREDVISLSLMPERISDTVTLAAEFTKSSLPVLMKVWCVVLACLLIYIFCKNLLFGIRMSKWQDVNHWTNLNWWKAPSGSSKELPLFTDCVYTCSVITSPIFRGVVRSTLYFPENMTEEKSIRFTASHHATHHKRKDLLLKLAAVIISAVHWFNPFVWLLYYCFQEDCEISCVYKTAGNMTETEKRDYLKLLTQSAGKQSAMSMIAAFGFSKQFQEKKLDIVMDRGKRHAAGTVALALCMLCVLGVTTSYTYQRELTVEETIIKYLEDPVENSHLAIQTFIDMEHVEFLEFISLEKEPIINQPWPHVNKGEGLNYTKFRVYTVTYEILHDEDYEFNWISGINGVQIKEFILIYTKDGWRIHSIGFSAKSLMPYEKSA